MTLADPSDPSFEQASLLLEPVPSAPAVNLTPKQALGLTATDLPTIGLSLAALLELRKSATGGEGIYRVIFPQGVSGHLAVAKDGGGYLGAILGDTGIAGQARLVPVGIDPLMLATTLALAAVTQQLNRIEQTQREILSFFKQDKESQAVGDLHQLDELTRNLTHQFNSAMYRTAAMMQAHEIKRRAAGNIDFYRKQIYTELNKQPPVMTSRSVSRTLNMIAPHFVNYRTAVRLYAHATFLEAALADNRTLAYLKGMKKEIRDRDFHYRELYTQCSDALERNKAQTIDATLKRTAAKITTEVGHSIETAPLLSGCPADEVLLRIGQRLDHAEKASQDRIIQSFAMHREAHVKPFIEGIDSIGRFINKPVSLLVSSEGVFLEA